MNEDIPCNVFRERIPGLTPKEHEEMRLLEQVELKTQKWREEDLAWQRTVDANITARHNQALRFQIWTTILGSVISGGAVSYIVAQWLKQP